MLVADSIRTSFALYAQLKATRMAPVEQNGRFSFSLALKQYNRLRETRIVVPRLLIVLYLPQDAGEWLRHSEDALVAKRCAYWVSLRGAPASENEAAQTIYIPRAQSLSVRSLTDVMIQCSRDEELSYVA